MSKRTKWGVGGGILLAIALIGGLSAMKGRNKATEVRIEQVEKRDLVASVTASGQVEPHTKVDVASDITGRITRLAVKEGDIVTKGQFLLEVDPAAANLAQAKHTYDRTVGLKRRNPTLVSDEQIDQLKTTVQVNQAMYD